MSRKTISLCVLGLLWLVTFMEVSASPAGVTVTAYADRVRFEAPDSIKELRVQLYALSGEQIIDSGTLRDTALDWQLGNHQGQRVATGVYLYAITFKNADGKFTKQLGKVALVQGRAVSQAPALSVPTIGRLVQLTHCAPGDDPFPCADFTEPRWRELLDADNSDNFRLQRRENSSSPYLTLLQLDIVDPANPNGNLKIHQLCLGAINGVGGDCRSAWPSGGASSGWVDDGTIVRLVTDTDNVGIGTPTPTEKLSVAGNISTTGTIDSMGQMSKIRFHYNTAGELPNPSTYHGMFAHVHDVGKAYFAHAGAWVELSAITAVTAGSGLSGGGTSGAVTLSLLTSCSANQILKWNGSTWACATDDTGSFSGWALTGNSGTSPGTNFMGTSDNQALEFKVNNARALRLEPGSTPNLTGGYSGNTVSGGAVGATIAGGGVSGAVNQVTNNYGTVSGGFSNTASGDSSTVSGGSANTASGDSSTVSGGSANTAINHFSTVSGGQFNIASGQRATVGGGYGNSAGDFSTVGGGRSNTASGFFATVGGGDSNMASGFVATVGGGHNNTAAGDYSFVVGRRAKNTDASHDGVFLFADSTDADFSSTAANEFAVRASGGYRLYSNSGLTAGVTLAAGAGAWASVSDRALKENFRILEGRAVLHRLSLIPITEWNYKAQDAAIRHLGPMAQDFYAAFGLGEDDRHITTIDADGIALISIQALYELSLQKDKKIETLTQEVNELREQLQALQQKVEALTKR
jgi:hypothetical protein